jgi:hypothetical protein
MLEKMKVEGRVEDEQISRFRRVAGDALVAAT